MGGIGSRIRELRAQVGLSQKDFGSRVGVTAQKISALEGEITRPDVEFLVAARSEFGVSADWILTGEETLRPVMLPPDHVPIKRQLQELVDAVKNGVIERIADEEAQYIAAQPGKRIPLQDIEGEKPVPWAGDAVAKTAEMIEAPPGVDDPRAFAGRLADDSMFPEFQEGDILFFSPAAEIHDGDYACIRIDDRSTFRQVFIQDDIIRLVAANRTHPELNLARDQVKSMFRLVWRMTRC